MSITPSHIEFDELIVRTDTTVERFSLRGVANNSQDHRLWGEQARTRGTNRAPNSLWNSGLHGTRGLASPG